VKKVGRNIIIILAFLLVIPVAVAVTGFCSAPQFTETYYGELGAMHSRLKHAEGNKIVIIGTSSVAFGVDSALIEEELAAGGAEYTVCNFGLYGAIGTKAMLDLSRKYIGEGDVVVFAPELSSQTLSLYFSAKEFWRAADGNFYLLNDLAKENLPEMTGTFAAFTAEKMKYAQSGGIVTEGVYQRASFDERCDMKLAAREGNIMTGGYDPENPIVLSGDVFEPAFLEYLNDYAKEIQSRGARMCFSFPPMNRLAVQDGSNEAIESFYAFLTDRLSFKVISNAAHYIMDAEWFYDTNYHLNEAGMTVRSIHLLEDLKNELGIYAPTRAEYPEKPPFRPPVQSDEEGDNTFASYFVFGEDESGNAYITGMTEEGKRLESVVIPFSYRGKPVTGFAANVFENNETIREITVQRNVSYLRDNSFSGCKRLERVVLLHDSPAEIRTGYRLLDGTAANVCVKQRALSAFQTDYTWGYYAERTVGYEA